MKANLKATRNFGADEAGVSPVVATLMLILVAAGAAVGIGVFMNDFQETSTKDVSTPSDAATLSIGGSSTVFEFSQAAVPGFEAFMKQRGTPVKVELEKGGSGAGRQAAGLCLVDIGSSSSPVKAEELEIWPDCDGIPGKDFGVELNIFKVATDGVVFAMTPINTHCLTGHVPALTQAQAYELYYKQANSTAQGTVDLAKASKPANSLTATETTVVTWAQIPTLALATGVVSAPGAGACGGTGGGTGGANTVYVFDRKDPGGTSEIASEKLLGKKQNQLEDAGITLVDAQQGDGNQGVLTAVKAHANQADALFFTSFGYGVNQGLTISAFGNSAANIMVPDSGDIKEEKYDATRPILYITAGEPTGVAKLWIDYVMNPHRNQLLAEEAEFETIY